MSDVNAAIIERLEKVVDSLQENSVKMGQLLAVHNEKLDKQDKVDEVQLRKVVKEIYVRLMTVLDSLKKRCGLFLVLLLLYLSSCLHQDKQSLKT